MLERRVYRPNECLIEVKENPLLPVIFLAGPIQGSEDWQKKAIEIISKSSKDVIIASPRRENITEKFVFEDQMDWETYHLKKAGEKGVVMFWLAKEIEHSCKRAYAQTSRIELGEWKKNHEIYEAKLVVGIEPGFTGERYIRRRLSQDCPDVPIFDNLEETCQKTVELALKREVIRIGR